jgi:threonine synthase
VVAIDTPLPWRCPYESGDRHHVLVIETSTSDRGIVRDDPNPFVRYLDRLSVGEFAKSQGLAIDRMIEIVHDLDERVAGVAGTGFRTTPLLTATELAAALGFQGRLRVKDETNNVAGSHKARHLFGILLHLVVAERTGCAPWAGVASRPPLAISSCGNAAIAASTLAAAAEWPIDVFIPEWAGGIVVESLDRLGARVHRCPRHPDDPPGDPTVHRFREAVADGAIPFSVQGPENSLCLDGGRTIGWEIAEQLSNEGVNRLDAVFVQVGGGAFAASLSRGLGEGGVSSPLVAVQTEGCAPLHRAWMRRRESVADVASLGAEWTHYMWPWESEPVSVADGILDDETYDWIVDLTEIDRTQGRVVVATEDQVKRAAELVPKTVGINGSPTGTAGVAGLVAEIENGALRSGDLLVVASGILRQ